MPQFTIEASYELPVYKHDVVEAPTLEDAIQRVLEEGDWKRSTLCYDASGPVYISGAWQGEEAYAAGKALEVPHQFSYEENNRKDSAMNTSVAAPAGRDPVKIARELLATHHALMGLEDTSDPSTDLWHLLFSLAQYCKASGVDFEATLNNVREELPAILS